MKMNVEWWEHEGFLSVSRMAAVWIGSTLLLILSLFSSQDPTVVVGLWESILIVAVVVFSFATATMISHRETPFDVTLWLLYIVAILLLVGGVVTVWLGQHQAIYGPDSWGYFSGGNVVVLGYWMALIGAVVAFLMDVLRLLHHGKVRYGITAFLAAVALAEFMWQLDSWEQLNQWFAGAIVAIVTIVLVPTHALIYEKD
jgi:ABC-type multidrug transport system permease subunit